MANTDLRYRRTERFLLEAMGEALQERPLDKITVTSLAAAADINKATFYLHYRDIYDLAEAYVKTVAQEHVDAMDYLPSYFGEPHRFAACLVADFEANKEKAMRFERNGLMHLYLDAFARALHQHLQTIKPIDDGRRGTMMTTFVINGVLSLLPRYGDDADTIIEVAGDVMTALSEHARIHFDRRPDQAGSSA